LSESGDSVFYNTWKADMMFGIAENRVPERRATAVVCQIVGKNGSFTQLLAFFAFFVVRHLNLLEYC
jgi:hypothetical protein